MRDAQSAFLAKLFSTDSAKAVKAQKQGYLNGIHYMAPYNVAGVGDLCGNSSPACRVLCLGWESGQAGMVGGDTTTNSVRESRIAKARRFKADRNTYLEEMAIGIAIVCRKARRLRLRPCIRCNGSTDLAFESMKVTLSPATAARITRLMGWRKPLKPGTYASLMAIFPRVQFVDYTKSARRAMNPNKPANYHLTFSRSEINEEQALAIVASGAANAAVVFDNVPATYRGLTVIDGDKHDLRHLDQRGVIVGLSPKGRKAQSDTMGFIVRGAA